MLSPRGRGRPHTIRDTLRGSTVSWFPCAGVLSRTSPHGRCRPQARATRPPAGLPKCGRESSLSDCSPKGGSCSRFPGIASARCGASRSVWPTSEVTGIWCLCSASVPGPRNVRAADGRVVLHRGKRRNATLTEVPVVDRGPVLRRYVEKVPGGGQHIAAAVGPRLRSSRRSPTNVPFSWSHRAVRRAPVERSRVARVFWSLRMPPWKHFAMTIGPS